VLVKYLATLTTFVLMWLPRAYVAILRTTGEVDYRVVMSSHPGVLGHRSGTWRSGR
jgi:hypothetical protein